MKLLVMGAGGFIGSNLVEHLLKQSEHEVIALDTESEKLQDVDTRESRFTFHRASVADADFVESLVMESDVVVDLVAYANPSLYVSRPLDVVDLNFFQNMSIVEDCIKYRKRLIQFSTCEVYGVSAGSREPFNEDTTSLIMGPVKNQRWIYAAAKQLLERIIFAHGVQGDLEFSIVRPFNFVGPKIDYLVDAGSVGGPRVFSHFMSGLLQGGPLQLVDGGAAHRSYTHISDAVEGIRLIIENPESCRNEIFNIGNPANGTTIRQLAYLMSELYEELTGEPATSPIVDVSGERFYGSGYEDCDWRVPDVSKMTALGWKPRLGLRETFKNTMQWYLDHYAADGATIPSYLRAGREAEMVAEVGSQH